MAFSYRNFVGKVVPLNAVRSDDNTDWRQLSGVAFQILADLDRRRQKLAVSPHPEQQSKAA